VTFIVGARVAGTPQCPDDMFYIVGKDQSWAATRTCAVAGYCRAEHDADCFTRWTSREQKFCM